MQGVNTCDVERIMLSLDRVDVFDKLGTAARLFYTISARGKVITIVTSNVHLYKECNNARGLLHDDPERIRLLLRYAELH